MAGWTLQGSYTYQRQFGDGWGYDSNYYFLYDRADGKGYNDTCPVTRSRSLRITRFRLAKDGSSAPIRIGRLTLFWADGI